MTLTNEIFTHNYYRCYYNNYRIDKSIHYKIKLTLYLIFILIVNIKINYTLYIKIDYNDILTSLILN